MDTSTGKVSAESAEKIRTLRLSIKTGDYIIDPPKVRPEEIPAHAWVRVIYRLTALLGPFLPHLPSSDFKTGDPLAVRRSETWGDMFTLPDCPSIVWQKDEGNAYLYSLETRFIPVCPIPTGNQVPQSIEEIPDSGYTDNHLFYTTKGGFWVCLTRTFRKGEPEAGRQNSVNYRATILTDTGNLIPLLAKNWVLGCMICGSLRVILQDATLQTEGHGKRMRRNLDEMYKILSKISNL